MSSQAERLSAIIKTTVDGIIVIDSRGLIESFNPAAERLFGYSEAEVVGSNINILMPSPYHEEHDGYLERYLRTGQAAIIGKGRRVRGRRKDGSVFPLHLSVGEMTINGERKFTGVVHDVSDFVRIEDQLRASEERWRAVIESAIDGIVVIDAHGRIEAFNAAAVRLFGYREAEVIGQNVNMLMPAPYHDQHDGYLARYLGTGEARIIGKGRQVTGRRKDGSTFPLHLSVGETVTSGGERKFTGILHDLTERVELESRLREQTALAHLGEMAAVIAHEVKNPLAGIRGAVQVIGGRLPAESMDAKMMKEIISRIDSLDAMMKDLLLFARPPKPKRAPVDVLPLVQSTADLLKRDKEAAQVEIAVRGSAPLVSADSEMLKMVVQNVLINSVHAMQGRGRIDVAVDAKEPWLRIKIADNGPGIPLDIRQKVFTPFFTTKSRGTGLGLPTAKRFIEAHDGHISIETPRDGGTTVTLQLPL
jgi:two-component system, LuxR family, sensor kinase FixL